MSRYVFISYSSAAADRALSLQIELERQGIETWLDRDRVEDGDDLTPRIRTAIASATAFIAWYDMSYGESKWCTRELAVANSYLHGLEGSRRIIVVNPLESRVHITAPAAADRRHVRADDKTMEDLGNELARLVRTLEGTFGQPPIDYEFGGNRYTDRRELAEAIAANWDLGMQHLQHAGLVEAVGEALMHQGLNERKMRLSTTLRELDGHSHLQLSALIGALAGELPFRYRRTTIDHATAKALCGRPLLNDVAARRDLLEALLVPSFARCFPSSELAALSVQLRGDCDEWDNLRRSLSGRGTPLKDLGTGEDELALLALMRLSPEAEVDARGKLMRDLRTVWGNHLAELALLHDRPSNVSVVAALTLRSAAKADFRNGIAERRAARDEVSRRQVAVARDLYQTASAQLATIRSTVELINQECRQATAAYSDPLAALGARSPSQLAATHGERLRREVKPLVDSSERALPQLGAAEAIGSALDALKLGDPARQHRHIRPDTIDHVRALSSEMASLSHAVLATHQQVSGDLTAILRRARLQLQREQTALDESRSLLTNRVMIPTFLASAVSLVFLVAARSDFGTKVAERGDSSSIARPAAWVVDLSRSNGWLLVAVLLTIGATLILFAIVRSQHESDIQLHPAIQIGAYATACTSGVVLAPLLIGVLLSIVILVFYVVIVVAFTALMAALIFSLFTSRDS